MTTTTTTTTTDTLPAFVVVRRNGKWTRLRIRIRKTGVNFGIVGELVALNGRVVATTGVCPLNCTVAAHEGALALAARLYPSN